VDDLFSCLFRSQFRGRLEDFLTEGLVALLNRLTKAQQRKFVIDLLLAERTESSDLRDFEQLLKPATPLWKSQHPVGLKGKRGKPDIVLFDVSKGKKDPHPLMVVESKINAAFTKRGGAADEKEIEAETPPDDEGLETGASGAALSQLEFYGHWLKSIEPRGALVLLTYKREQEGFLEKKNTKKFGVALRARGLWITLSEWISEENLMLSDPVVTFLRDQLKEFLNNEGISGMTKNDTALLNRYLSKRKEIDKDGTGRLDAAERALEEIMTDAAKNPKLGGRESKYENGALLSDKSLKEKKKSFDNEEISLRFGFISCPNKSWGVDGPPGLQACTIVFLREGTPAELAEDINKKLKSWGKKGSDGVYTWWVRTKEVSNFLTAHSGFDAAFVNWADGELKEAEKRLRAVESRRRS
jgi:hypothetical protein